MMRFIYLLLLVSSLSVKAQQLEIPSAIPVGEDVVAPVREKTSSLKARKIQVQGKNNQLRMAISSIANEMAKELNMLLKEEDKYDGERMIFIEMYEEGKSKGSLEVLPRVTAFDDSELVLELLVDTRKNVNREILAHGIIDVLLYRRGLEGVKTLKEDQEVQVPAWLSHGLIESIEWRKDSSKRRVYEHLLAHPELFPLSQILSTTSRQLHGFDATDRAFFKAGSCALVLSLLRQDNGADAMSELLSEVVLFEGEVEELIRKYYPSSRVGANAIQKLWSLQIAEMAAPKMVETFTLVETEERLSKLLFFIVSDAEGHSQLVSLNDYKVLAEKSSKEKVLATEALRRGVIQLSNRAHPVYRPILVEYAQLTSELVAGNLENIETRLPVLESERQQIRIADERCRDYLDWYQISRAHEVKGDFSGYMKLKERLATEREERKDESIDQYLDQIQKLMERS